MKIGFMGAGAMGGAILSGAMDAGVVKPEDVYVSDFSEAIRTKFREKGCSIVANNEELAEKADIVVAAVKPQYAAPALEELGKKFSGKAMISIMAGLTIVGISTLEQHGVRGAFIDTVARATERAQELGKAN